MNTGFHPTGAVPVTQARATTGQRLLREFEEHQIAEVDRYDWEFFAAICVAKVRELENRLGADERRARSDLYPRGNVIALPKREAPAPPTRPGA